MTRIRSASKVSKRSSNTATKQTSKSKRSHPIVREAKRSKNGSRTPAVDSVASLADRIQAEREQLFKALAIVECCKYASATLLELGDFEFMVPVFEAVCDLLNTSAGELGSIADDYRHID